MERKIKKGGKKEERERKTKKIKHDIAPVLKELEE
jgi:hypothetical protein